MKFELPQKVNNIIKTLQAAGFEAYAVGGCVRDMMLGREPDDWDITTSAMPEEVKGLFRRTVDTGIKHGTVTVMDGKEGFEVTTYRIDGKYEDGRHPNSVTFTRSLEEDLKRRDFTINAMAYNNSEGLVDLYDGEGDLQKKIIRAVGDANKRFEEDALRIMRAVRFSAQLGFSIEEQTLSAMKTLAPNLEKISAERIQVELCKLLVSLHPDYLRVAYEQGMTKVFLPEFDRCMETPQNNPHHCYSVGEHILHSLELVPNRKELRLAMLLHDIAKPLTKTTDESGIDHFHGHAGMGAEIVKEILHRLKFDNDTIHKVTIFVRYHDRLLGENAKQMRRSMNLIGEDYIPDLLLIKKADTLAQSDYQREIKLEILEKNKLLYDDIKNKEQCVSLKQLALTGKDLINDGMESGKGLGEILQFLLEKVIEEPTLNTKEQLLELAREYVTK